MEDKEFIVYMIGDSLEATPSGVRYRNQKEAHDAAIRFSEKEGKSYYVIEVVMVCNTIEKVG